jgi:hypothetical protein
MLSLFSVFASNEMIIAITNTPIAIKMYNMVFPINLFSKNQEQCICLPALISEKHKSKSMIFHHKNTNPLLKNRCFLLL